MIFFANVFITDKRHPQYSEYDRGLYPQVSPYEVFKYSLASMSALPWTKVIIYCLLDDNYEHHKEDLEETVRSLFGDASLYLRRNTYQSEWQTALEEVFATKDELVWYTGNHDHVFIDYDLTVLERITSEMEKRLETEKYMSCYFSHWPELLAGISVWGFIDKDRSFFTYRRPDTDAIQIVTKPLLREWWWGENYGNRFIPRTDKLVKEVPMLIFVPMSELCRHFDGYRRNNCQLSINDCPPLFIPVGFWKEDINIAYGDKVSGYVHVNPCAENYSCVSVDGADMKCLLEDLPLFWRPRIKNVVSNNVNEKVIDCRNHSVWSVAKSVKETIIPNRDELSIAFR